MNIYCVRVTGYIPYPITREYTERGSNFAVAISRAIKKYIKENSKSRRIRQIGVQASRGYLSMGQSKT